MPLRVRKSAPYFRGQAVVDGRVKEISLDDYKGHYLVLLFYPMDFTYVSPTEILAFSDRATEFYHYNCSIVGLSTDSEFTHLAWMKMSREEGGLGGVVNISLLSDKSMKISRDYGVLDRDSGISHRGLYIIDHKGIIRHITINDLEVGRSVEETLRLVRAFQFTDRYIKVCQVDWKPGDRGLRPDPTQTDRYFEGYFGISREKSSVQIKEDQQSENISIEDKLMIRRPVREERVSSSLSAPSNSINITQTTSANRENVSLDSSLSPGNMHASTSRNDTFEDKLPQVEIDLQDNIKVYEDTTPKINKNPQKNHKRYTLYSTVLPNHKNLNNEPLYLPADIQSVTKSDTTQKYNHQQPQEPEKQLPKTDSRSHKNEDSKNYVSNWQLKEYMQSYYNNSTDVHNAAKDKPQRHELKNDEVFKHSEQQVSKESEVLKERRESPSFNRSNRRFKPGAKEIENVKDMTYHPLNDVLNIQPLNINNDHNIETRTSPSGRPTDRRSQNASVDESKSYSRNNQRNAEYSREYSSIRNRHLANAPSDTASQSSKEEHQHQRTTKDIQVRHSKNRHPASFDEAIYQNQNRHNYFSKNHQSSSQVVLEGGPTVRTLKSNLKRGTGASRHGNQTANFHVIREESRQDHNVSSKNARPRYAEEKMQFAEDKFNGCNG